MKRTGKIVLSAALSLLFASSACACGGGGGQQSAGGDSEKPSGPVKANIDFYTTVNNIEQMALQSVADAYSDLQYAKGNDITVTIYNSTDPDAYAQTLRNKLANGTNGATIAMVSAAPEYFGTNKIVDLADYLDQPNPYIEGNAAWSDALEKDAYRSVISGSSVTVPALSYSANYAAVFYNKKAMKYVMGGDAAVAEDGTVDQSKITWSWLLNALSAAKTKDARFKYPLGVSVGLQSCGGDNFNVLTGVINMYLDQYYRSFIADVHSREGDYSYIEAVDKDWAYDEDDPRIDTVGRYTYNINRAVDLFFNGEGYNPSSERYTEVMQNLYALTRYCDPAASYQDIFSRFNETALIFENKASQYSDLKLFYLETLGYVRTYRDAFKYDQNGKTFYPDAEQISGELGWFILPPMESELDGVAKNIRASGGPCENFGVLNTGNQTVNEYAVDFMRYLYSPVGQAAIYAKYMGENKAPVVMRPLVKGVNIPAAIDYTSLIDTDGNCDGSPYLLFGRGGDMSMMRVGNTATYVKDQIGQTFSDYFRSASGDWASSGAALFDTIKSGFSNYAAERKFIYNDYTRVAQATDGLAASPFNTSD